MSSSKPITTQSASAYSEADWDQAFRTSFQSDAIFVVTRAAIIALVFWLMARAITMHQVSATVLLLPWAAQWLAMLWGGLFLSRWIITCPAFRHDYYRPLKVAVFSTMIVATVLGVMWYDPAVAGVEKDSLDQLVAATAGTLTQSGLWIVVLIEALGAVLWVWPDIKRWRRNGGKFIWKASVQQSCRGSALFFLGILAIFIVPWFVGAEFLEDLAAPAIAWSVWGILLAVELIALVLSVWIHRDLLPKRQQPGAQRRQQVD